MKNIIVFGATGRVGAQVVIQGLGMGYKVRAFVRNPRKVGIKHQRLEIFKGDCLDKTVVESALKDMDAVISALGQKDISGEVRLMSEGMKNIISGMKKEGLKRLLTVGGAGILESTDGRLLRDQPGFPEFLQEVSADHYRVFESLSQSDLDWTLVCPPFIPEGPETGKISIEINRQPWGTGKIKSGDVGAFLIKEMKEGRFLRARVGINGRP